MLDLHLDEAEIMGAMFVAGVCVGWVFAVLKGVA